MGNKDENNEINPFEKQVNEFDEWQKNANNPGYFIGSGKVPLPLKNMFKSTKIMIIVGFAIALPTLYSLIVDFSIQNVMSNVMPILTSIILIAGGVIRTAKRN